MDFDLTDDQATIRTAVAELAGKFDDHALQAAVGTVMRAVDELPLLERVLDDVLKRHARTPRLIENRLPLRRPAGSRRAWRAW